jgi:hypothetical protein
MKEQLNRMLESSLYRRKLAKDNYERARARLQSATEEVRLLVKLTKDTKEGPNGTATN